MQLYCHQLYKGLQHYKNNLKSLSNLWNNLRTSCGFCEQFFKGFFSCMRHDKKINEKKLTNMPSQIMKKNILLKIIDFYLKFLVNLLVFWMEVEWFELGDRQQARGDNLIIFLFFAEEQKITESESFKKKKLNVRVFDAKINCFCLSLLSAR